MKKLRIFHGLSEVAGQAYYSVKGLRYFGVPVTHMLWEPNPAKYDYDAALNIDLKRKYMFPIWGFKMLYYEYRLLKSIDVFHFHFGRSLLLNWDLPILKKFGKKVYYEFHGSDLRDYKRASERNVYMICSQSEKSREKLKRRIEKICVWADGVILHDDELLEYIPSDFKRVYIVPLRVDIGRIEAVYVNRASEKVRIVHAPTNREVKGTEYIIKAFEKLKDKYPIELVLVERKTQEEAFELYKTADIIVDQIRIGTYGVFAIEGMALGKPVITYIADDMKGCLPEELPICSANPDTIEAVLERLVQDSELRYELGIAGRKYVEKYHDYRKNAEMLYEIYNGEIEPMRGTAAFSYAAQERME